MNPVFFSILIAMFSLTFTACSSDVTREQSNDSSVKKFTTSQLQANHLGAHLLAKRATGYLKSNGWCNIDKKYLPSGWTHDQLVRQMACISNKESTFGRYTTGPHNGAGRCGTPYGFWQVAECHLGKSVGEYSCPNVGIATLRDNPNISARCSLYVYMERELRGMSGFAPWEAKCSIAERDLKLSNGQFVYPSSCDSANYEKICKSTMKVAFDDTGDFATVQVSSECPAAKIEHWLLSGSAPKQEISKTQLVLLNENGKLKTAKINLSMIKSQNPEHSYDLLRLAFKKNNELYYKTNPSIALP